MTEFAFVWIGIGALVLLFWSATLGGRINPHTPPSECVTVILLVLLFWPYFLAPAYRDRKNFKF